MIFFFHKFKVKRIVLNHFQLNMFMDQEVSTLLWLHPYVSQIFGHLVKL